MGYSLFFGFIAASSGLFSRLSTAWLAGMAATALAVTIFTIEQKED